MDIDRYLRNRKELIDSALMKILPNERDYPPKLCKAMRYSILNGGKRIRPVLAMAAFDAVGGKGDTILPFACALEFIHTYSLIHDDLPAMDDDDFRRGKPSSHKKYGEAVAILTGDALLTEAFGQMLKLSQKGGFPPAQVIKAIELLACYSGVRGMVGGQLLDVTIEPHSCTLPEIDFIHIHKTGALILASVLIPAYLLPVEESKINKIIRYCFAGKNIK